MRNLLCAISLLLFTQLTLAHNPDEHRALADSVFTHFLNRCKCSEFTSEKPLWKDLTFAGIAGRETDFDLVAARFHDRGKTILEQLQGLSSDDVTKLMAIVTGPDSPDGLYPQELSQPNVIRSYLLHHLAALRLAEHDNVRKALIFEAMAQSFLIDAFSSGHMLVPMGDLFYGLHPVNTQDAHGHFSVEGTFVMNSHGQVWRAFGDGLLEWYDRSYDHIYEACLTSLQEVFLVYYRSKGIVPDVLKQWAEILPQKDIIHEWTQSHDAAFYLDSLRMPALLLIPVPVAAAWSIRRHEVDANGSHLRSYYPQVRECRDVRFRSDNIDEEFLHAAASYPAWALPDFFLAPQSHLDSLIRYDTAVASVKYVQERYFPPSYGGLLLAGSWSLGSTEHYYAISAGMDLGADLLMIDKLSAECSFINFRGSYERRLVSPAAGFSFHPGLLFQSEDLPAIHVACGYAWGWTEQHSAHGGRLDIGLEPGRQMRWLKFPGTYLGILPRLNYQVFYLEQNIHALTFSIMLH